MQEISVTIVDVDSTIHVVVHEGLADVMIGSLAAEPDTAHELQIAMGRFVDPLLARETMERASNRSAAPYDLGDPTHDGGRLLISLPSRLLVNATTTLEIPRIGSVPRCSSRGRLDGWLPYRLPDEWHLVTDVGTWQALDEERRTERERRTALDVRQVLYGGLAAALVDYGLESLMEPKSDGPRDSVIQEIQARWLLTERTDLQQATARHMLLRDRAFIDGDIEDMAQIWMRQGRCPPPLPRSSAAYRRGGFGSKEIILYHELTAYLLGQLQQLLDQSMTVRPASFADSLARRQQEWLHLPQERLFGESPAAVVARERSRLPARVPSTEACLDDDCPVCRMMADDDLPVLWHLEQGALERHFATSFFPSQREWDVWNSGDRPENPNGCEFGRLSINQDSTVQQSLIWNDTYTNMSAVAEMTPQQAVAVLAFGLGSHLAELVQDLQAEPRYARGSDSWVEPLHDHFDQLRHEVRQRATSSTVERAADLLIDHLATVAQTFSTLQAKCRDLAEKVEAMVECYRKIEIPT